jgi:hypothetical protein
MTSRFTGAPSLLHVKSSPSSTLLAGKKSEEPIHARLFFDFNLAGEADGGPNGPKDVIAGWAHAFCADSG